MTTITPTSLYISQAAADSPETDGEKKAGGFESLGKSDFLRLLVAQLQHQDPLSPLRNEDFIAQLATFSSLEQLISINEAVTKLVNGNGDVTASESA
ncbi:MAG: hypothetical protein HXY20_10825 [Acidobacteria bacterium]|nr:hypothetical protein [Acidobacteriota bacterium]